MMQMHLFLRHSISITLLLPFEQIVTPEQVIPYYAIFLISFRDGTKPQRHQQDLSTIISMLVSSPGNKSHHLPIPEEKTASPTIYRAGTLLRVEATVTKKVKVLPSSRSERRHF
ncbi:unnamed protein product [Amoebophrya sp. A120]|nr:unnamed protein product [Amoebophrya sp. A120]|eukprot:GSA120T00014757001.1